LLQLISRDVVAQANRRHRYEAVVERVQEVPVGLNDGENGRGNEKEDDQDKAEDDEDVGQSNVKNAERLTEASQQSFVHERRHQQESLDQSCEQDQRQWNANYGVHDAEDFTAVGQRRYVTVSYAQKQRRN